MSINDLLDSDVVIPGIILGFILMLIIVIPASFSTARKTNNNIYGANETGNITKEENAKIIARRSNPHPLNQTLNVNSVVFEFTNSNRIELAIKDPDIFGTMIEGDYGTLQYQGKKFIDFKREKKL